MNSSKPFFLSSIKSSSNSPVITVYHLRLQHYNSTSPRQQWLPWQSLLCQQDDSYVQCPTLGCTNFSLASRSIVHTSLGTSRVDTMLGKFVIISLPPLPHSPNYLQLNNQPNLELEITFISSEGKLSLQGLSRKRWYYNLWVGEGGKGGRVRNAVT